MSDTKQNNYTLIDVENWERKDYFCEFRNKLNPCNTITFELDITNLYNMIKRKKLSFTLSLTYASVKCAREVEAFRYRNLNGNVVLYHDINTRFSYVAPDGKHFRTISAPLKDTLEEFIVSALTAIENQVTTFPEFEGYGYIQTAPSPWITTSISHTVTGGDDDAVPLIGWGKYFVRNERVIIPYTIKTNHCFVDGRDQAEFVNKLVCFIENC